MHEQVQSRCYPAVDRQQGSFDFAGYFARETSGFAQDDRFPGAETLKNVGIMRGTPLSGEMPYA